MSEEAPEATESTPPSDAAPTVALEDFEQLKASVEKLEAKNRELIEEKRRTQEAARQAEEDAARKSGDVEALEKSWQAKLAELQQARDAEIQQYRAMVEQMTVGSAAQKLAADLAVPGSADVLVPHIRARLAVEERDGVPEVRVLDAEGKPSAATIEDLRAEFAAHPAFAPVVAGSRASGAGHHGGAPAAPKRFDDYSPSELVELRRTSPDQYERLRATRKI